MKKKVLLISIMMVVLACMLAISAFADDIIASKTESEEYGTVIQLNSDPGLDNASKYVSTLKKINDNGTDKDALCILTDGTYFYVFPSSYVVDEREDGVFDIIATPLATAIAEFNTANGTSYYANYATDGSGGGKRLNSIARFEFPSSVLGASASVCCMRSYSSLVEVRFNYPINLSGADSMFKGDNKLTTVVDFENADPNLASAMFIGCSSLESISFPTGITKIPNSMFWGCKKIVISNLAECTQLTTIGKSAFQDTSYLNFVLPDSVTTIEANAFQSAFKGGSGGSFVINKTSQLVSIGASAFEDCRQMPENVYIPSTVTSIGASAFKKCYTLQTLENFENCQITAIENGTFEYASALKTLKIPETVTTIGTAFADNNVLTLVYIPKSVTSIADTFTGGKPTNAVYIYTGNDARVFSACTKLANANQIPGNEYNPENTYTGINLVVGYSHCVAYNGGIHKEKAVKNIKVITYYDAITVDYKCTLCEMKIESRVIPALFTCLGYSVPENGGDGIAVGYTINLEAIKEYEKASGKTLKYGVYAALKDKLGANDIFDENGDAIANAVVAQVSDNNYVAVEFKITGFTDAYKDLKLAMGAYVIATDKEGTEYSYLQAGTPIEGEKYSFVSYNEVAAGKPTEKIN